MIATQIFVSKNQTGTFCYLLDAKFSALSRNTERFWEALCTYTEFPIETAIFETFTFVYLRKHFPKRKLPNHCVVSRRSRVMLEGDRFQEW